VLRAALGARFEATATETPESVPNPARSLVVRKEQADAHVLFESGEGTRLIGGRYGA
jgi:hypothetical protein